jgi:methylenetetrahydrofolate reductase (NADPH)
MSSGPYPNLFFIFCSFQPQEALSHWGYPTSPSDISTLFTSYLQSQTPSIPWCPTPLDTESHAILPLLLKLNSPDLGWWTVGSQPPVDGARSEDEVYGFGPRGGYVFQKGFVEFFVKESVVEELEKRAEKEGGLVTFYAGNRKVRFVLFRSTELTLELLLIDGG